MLLKLFPDAEVLEDVSEGFVGGDFAEDGAEGGDCGAEVLREEIAGEAVLERLLREREALRGLAQSGVVPRRSDYRAFTLANTIAAAFYRLAQLVQAGARER